MIKVRAKTPQTRGRKKNPEPANPRQIVGVYGDRRYYAGQEFFIKNEEEMGSWMEVVKDKPAPEVVVEENNQLQEMNDLVAELSRMKLKDLMKYVKENEVVISDAMSPEEIITAAINNKFPVEDNPEE